MVGISRQQYFVFFLGLLLGGALFYLYGGAGHDAFPEYTAETKEIFSEYWAEKIRTHGAGRAYQMFQTAYPDTPLSYNHAEAHAFGGALYDTLGLEGLSTCDEQYAYGCYHEFLSRAILEHGPEYLDTLYEACLGIVGDYGSQTTCRHGIGHGIQSYLGYDKENLIEALKYCGSFPKNDIIGGCYGGAFMEYNMRTILSVDGIPPRPAEGDLSEPCLSVPDQFKEACYYQQTQWWVNVLEGTAQEVYAQMGEQCGTVQDPQARKACFEGIGKVMLLNTTNDMSEIVSLCAVASTDEQSELHCRSVAANLFHVINGQSPNRTEELCTGFSDEVLQHCKAHSVNDCSALEDDTYWLYCNSGR